MFYVYFDAILIMWHLLFIDTYTLNYVLNVPQKISMLNLYENMSSL